MAAVAKKCPTCFLAAKKLFKGIKGQPRCIEGRFDFSPFRTHGSLFLRNNLKVGHSYAGFLYI